MSSTIQSVHARQIFDSRGNPTVEVDIVDSQGGLHRAAVPSGASTGVHEALELRDKGKAYAGKGVTKAVSNVNDIIAPQLAKSGIPLTDQKKIDEFLLNLDGTENKSKLGANAILGVSMAAARAGATSQGVPLYTYLAKMAGTKTDNVLPVPFMNVINGGSHAGNGLAFQEFMLAPTGAKTFTEAMQMGTEIYHTLQKVITKHYGSTGGIGDEGGFAPNVKGADDTLEVLTEAIEVSGYRGKVSIAMDVASSEFFKDGKYDLNFKDEKNPQLVSGDELADMYISYIDKYPIVSIEDPFAEDDWESWTQFLAKVEGKVQVVGDDLTVTNPVRIKKAIETKACNALLLKINQIGTITESLRACKDSLDAGWGVMVSHRSGETGDTFIADLAVALGGGQLKTGAPARSERVDKYNQLLRIEEQLGSKAKYAGLGAIPGRSA